MDATVYSKKVKGPATHALVIGVGHYPHLPGGKGKKMASSWGMRQLSSPPVSARAIARWLIESYHHPSKALASVSLLLSDTNNQEFSYLAGAATKTLQTPVASMANLKTAVEAWYTRGSKSPDHLLLFYFCGHGIAALPDLALLLSDFGADKLAPLDGALDFRRFRQNMEECAAREQCYFLDACRVGSDLLIKNSGFAGLPVVHNSGALNASGRIRQMPVFYSTMAGEPAYGKRGAPSLFTTALLEGLAGAGCDESPPGQWQVQTTFLHHALNKLMRDSSERLALPQTQINPADDLTLLELNVVREPQVPVVVTCFPEDANAKATFKCESGAFKESRGPKKGSWRLKLPVGEYDFAAEFKNPLFNSTTKKYPIRPAFPKVSLKVGTSQDWAERVASGFVAPREHPEDFDIYEFLVRTAPTAPKGPALPSELPVDAPIRKVSVVDLSPPAAGASTASIWESLGKLTGTTDLVATLSQGKPALEVSAYSSDSHRAVYRVTSSPASNAAVRGAATMNDQPSRHFAIVPRSGWVELLALPIPWQVIRSGREASIEIVTSEVDDENAFCVSATARDEDIGPLLGYLSSGLLPTVRELAETAQDLLFRKWKNPYAACAGGYALVGTARAAEDREWHEWIRNLMQRFPGIPDGAIQWAQLRLKTRRSQSDIEEARTALKLAYRRGLPFYSMGMRLLLEGLEWMSRDDPEAEVMMKNVRRLAWRANFQQPFTILKIGGA